MHHVERLVALQMLNLFYSFVFRGRHGQSKFRQLRGRTGGRFIIWLHFWALTVYEFLNGPVMGPTTSCLVSWNGMSFDISLWRYFFDLPLRATSCVCWMIAITIGTFWFIFAFMIMMSGLSTFRTFLQYVLLWPNFWQLKPTLWIWNIHFCVTKSWPIVIGVGVRGDVVLVSSRAHIDFGCISKLATRIKNTKARPTPKDNLPLRHAANQAT